MEPALSPPFCAVFCDVFGGAFQGFSGRNIKEVCEAAERRCASRIVRGDSKPGSLPLYGDYDEAIKGRLFSGLQ